MTKLILHPEFGTIHIIKSSRSKRISITLKPFREIRITIPTWVTYHQAFDVIKKREDWIRKNINKIKSIENNQTIFNNNTPFKTRYHQLVIEPKPIGNLKFTIKNGKALVQYPESVKVENEKIQHFIKKAIEETLRIEAKKYLPTRVFQLSKKHGFSYNIISIRNSKTRWGSCSHKNNISLSLHLMRLPDHLIDFIILHELVHTKVKNHSSKFWQELEKIVPNVKELKKELKRYRISIF